MNVLEDRQGGDDVPTGALDRRRKLKGGLLSRASDHVADHGVYLGEVVVVINYYHHGTASGEALGLISSMDLRVALTIA